MERMRHFFHKDTFAEWMWFLVPFVLLLIPFVLFVKSNAYPMLTPEIFLCLLGIGIGGLVLGLVDRFGRSARALVISGTLTFVIDAQSELLFRYSLHQYVWLPIGLWILIFFENILVNSVRTTLLAQRVGFADAALPTQQTLASFVGLETVRYFRTIDSRVPKAPAAKLQLGGDHFHTALIFFNAVTTSSCSYFFEIASNEPGFSASILAGQRNF